MNLKVKNNYISHLSGLKTDYEKQRFLDKLNNDADRDNESALVARCILRLEGEVVEKNVTDSLKTLDALVKDRKSAVAAYVLGLIYKDGVYEQKRSAHKADDYLRIAAGKGESSAAYELGRMYLDGDGVRKDLHEAVRWIELAASKGDLNSMVLYGTALLNGGVGAFGDSVAPNPSKAIGILTKASDSGSEVAKESLSKHYAMMALELASQINDPSNDLETLYDALSNIEWILK